MEPQKISFDNTEIAFAGKTDKDITRAYWLFKFISINWLVKVGPSLVNFALKIHFPIKGLIRSTVFRHFCGGENIEGCERAITDLAKYNIGTILDYSVEGREDEESFDSTRNEILRTVDYAAKDKRIAFCVFKPTGLARHALLEKIQNKELLTNDEQAEYLRIKNRIEAICRTCYEKNITLFIDAEQSWIQDPIDDIALEMMRKFNKEKIIVYTTIQMYRTDRLHYLKKIYNLSMAENFRTGFKIVRGAYMEKERIRASQMGYPSPIHITKADTDRDYDASVAFCLDHYENVAVCAGTHNEKSSMNMAQFIIKNNIPKNHPHLHFSQLIGMSDHISYNVAHAGFNVTKYVPYGPVELVLPYLFRRAQENTSVKGQTGRELSLIIRERERRKNERMKE